KSFDFFSGRRLNVFAVADFTGDYNYRGGENGELSMGGEQLKDGEQVRYEYATHPTGKSNAEYVLNPSHRFSYNFLFVNSSDQSADSYYGFIRDIAEDGSGLVQRNTFRQTKLFVNQLLGNHTLTEKIDV